MHKYISILFYLFLTCPILAPFIGGVTIYLSGIVIFFDKKFINWMTSRLTRNITVSFIILLALLFLFSWGKIILIFKILSLITSCAYVYYTYYVTRNFYLYQFVILNVVLAVFQFTFIFIKPSIADNIGPTKISKFIFGEYARPTLTNFYSISILPRVSGMSSEGGFFASLLGVVMIILINDKFIEKKRKRIVLLFLLIGLLFSLSKSTFLLILIPLPFIFRKQLDKVGVILSSLLIIMVMTIFFNLFFTNTTYFLEESNASLFQRFAGYILSPYLIFWDFFIGGIDVPYLIKYSPFRSSYLFNLFSKYGLNDICGWPNIYLGYGVQVFIVFLLFLKVLGIKGSNILVITILTANVDPITNTGFVVLSWFLCLLMNINSVNTIKYMNYNNGNDFFSKKLKYDSH